MRDTPEYSIQMLNSHNEKVTQLAEKYNRKLLVLDVTNDKEANAKISKFIGLDQINAFPYANRTL